MELGRSAAEIALTKHLAKTIVQDEVINPMAAIGWGHGNPPNSQQAAVAIAERARADGATTEQITEFLAGHGVKYTPPASGQPATTEGAPTTVVTPKLTAPNGQPVQQPVTTPAPVVKTDAPNAEAAANLLSAFESLKDANGLYMGKYKTVDEALKGAGHLANMAKDALRRAEAAETRLTTTPSAATIAAPPAAAPAVAPVSPFVPKSHPALELAKARLDKVLSKVRESGFDGDSAVEYAEATSEVARETSKAVAVDERDRAEHARNAESERWTAVNAFMAEKYPDSQYINDDEFNLFLRMNPLLTDSMQALRATGREVRAAELGYTEFIKARGGVPGAPGTVSRAEAGRVEDDLAAREQVRMELRDKALKDAGIVHGSAGGSSAAETPGIVGPSQDDINAMAAAMRREGEAPGSQSAAQWRHATIGRFLPPEIFGQR